ncbi:unnamed protein product [Cuscuta campestris]|uniref:Condensin-2 complex subunit H2 n=1 Tax=Cuscuta campestris TaxID=132261 RepID=A0A484KCU7_9ASTE|nr:unnamed protein product [Cuscuta campestris]
MKTKEQEQAAGSSFDFSEKIHTLQPLRDLESNWSVDLAKNLEDYLLKICSGEISGRDGASQNPVNFSEAALLLQGSAQVYSRKVEYLYSLVLHALESLSQTRISEKEQQPDGSATTEEGASNAPEDPFWGVDGIPVDPKNSRDSSASRDELLNHVVKAPANLVVLESDCLDTTGDAGELDLYLLATCDMYRDFILLDTCDVVAIDCYLNNGNKTGKRLNSSCKVRKSVNHSTRRSGGVGSQSSARKNQDPNLNMSPVINNDFSPDDHMHENNDGFYGTGYMFSEPMDFSGSDEDDDPNPWKPLNPHEPGNLSVKPYRRVTANRRQGMCSKKQMYVTTVFPLARLHGTIDLHLKAIWEKCFATKKTHEFQSLSLYEKLRQSLSLEETNDREASHSPENNEDNDYDNVNVPDFDTHDAAEHSDDEHLDKDMHANDGVPFDHEGHEDPNTHATLADLCRSHLDSLLENLAESEHQTEMATRVSTWKQRIEQNLNEQELRPTFDIHEYGNKVLTKLSLKEESGNGVSFSDIVSGEEKHDVARTFSALLQLVNNGDVDLQKDRAEGESNGYTAANPFYVRLLRRGANARKNINLQSPTKKKSKASALKRHPRGEKSKRGGKGNRPGSSSPPGSNNSTHRFAFQVCNGTRCTPEGKKRRKSQFSKPLELQTGVSLE